MIRKMSEKVFPKKIRTETEKDKVKNGKEAAHKTEKTTHKPARHANDSDMAAIAMALYLYFDDQHEVEQTGFWLNRPLNQQTTWTAKNNLFRKLPVRKF
jgi:hypothetical protein